MSIKKKGEYKVYVPEIVVQKSMLKADQIHYFSQIKEFPWEVVARRTCGITAAAMAISFFHSEVKPMDVLAEACLLHQVPVGEKCSWVTFEDGEKKIVISVGREMDAQLAKALAD